MINVFILVTIPIFQGVYEAMINKPLIWTPHFVSWPLSRAIRGEVLWMIPIGWG